MALLLGFAACVAWVPAFGAPVRELGFRIEQPTCELVGEVAPFSTFVGIDADLDDFGELLDCVVERDLEAVVELTDLLFERGSPNGGPSPPTRLFPDHLERWDDFVLEHLERLGAGSVRAFYLADEPFWNGIALDELLIVERLVDSAFPLVPTMTSLGEEDLRRLPPAIPDSLFDLVGYHAYGRLGDPVGDPVYRAELDRLRERFPGRSIMIVADAWWDPGLHGERGIAIDETGERARGFLAIAEEVGAVALGAFVWDGVGAGLGLRDLPDPEVREWIQLGRQVTGRCGVPATLSPRDGPRVLHLGGDCRFHAVVRWRVPWTGESGRGFALPMGDDSGLYWFFRRSNLEAMVKLLDGRPINGHWWLSWSAMSTLELELEVTDTATGTVRVYDAPVFDGSAFPDPELAPEPRGKATSIARRPGRFP